MLESFQLDATTSLLFNFAVPHLDSAFTAIVYEYFIFYLVRMQEERNIISRHFEDEELDCAIKFIDLL